MKAKSEAEAAEMNYFRAGGTCHAKRSNESESAKTPRVLAALSP